LFAIVTLPVMLGVLTHQFAKSAARRLRLRAHTLSMVLFVLMLVGAVAEARDDVVPYFAQAGLVTLVLGLERGDDGCGLDRCPWLGVRAQAAHCHHH